MFRLGSTVLVVLQVIGISQPAYGQQQQATEDFTSEESAPIVLRADSPVHYTFTDSVTQRVHRGSSHSSETSVPGEASQHSLPAVGLEMEPTNSNNVLIPDVHTPDISSVIPRNLMFFGSHTTTQTLD
ncbi:MAG: hypothetical protein AAFU53_04445 [Cyanobacteria bacterium J06632_3]